MGSGGDRCRKRDKANRYWELESKGTGCVEDKNMEQATIEQFADMARKWNKGKMMGGLYYLGLSFFGITVYSMLMDYSRAFTGSLLMTVSEGLMVGSFIFMYAVWYIFPYVWITGKDKKQSQYLLESIYSMPFSIEIYFSVIQRRFMRSGLRIGAAAFLILAAGMFVGPHSGGMEGNGLQIRMPENVFCSIPVCMIGTGWVLLCMALGFYIQKKLQFKMYYKKKGTFHKTMIKGRRKVSMEQQQLRRKHKKELTIFFSIILLLGILVLGVVYAYRSQYNWNGIGRYLCITIDSSGWKEIGQSDGYTVYTYNLEEPYTVKVNAERLYLKEAVKSNQINIKDIYDAAGNQEEIRIGDDTGTAYLFENYQVILIKDQCIIAPKGEVPVRSEDR